MDKIQNVIHIVIIVGFLIIIIKNIVMVNNEHKTQKKGKKIKGYIFDIEPWDDCGYNMNPKGAIKVYVDGKIKRISKIEPNEKYEKIYNMINTMYKVDEKINIKRIPVDVYIYNEQASIDLESAEV